MVVHPVSRDSPASVRSSTWRLRLALGCCKRRDPTLEVHEVLDPVPTRKTGWRTGEPYPGSAAAVSLLPWLEGYARVRNHLQISFSREGGLRTLVEAASPL